MRIRRQPDVPLTTKGREVSGSVISGNCVYGVDKCFLDALGVAQGVEYELRPIPAGEGPRAVTVTRKGLADVLAYHIESAVTLDYAVSRVLSYLRISSDDGVTLYSGPVTLPEDREARGRLMWQIAFPDGGPWEHMNPIGENRKGFLRLADAVALPEGETVEVEVRDGAYHFDGGLFGNIDAVLSHVGKGVWSSPGRYAVTVRRVEEPKPQAVRPWRVVKRTHGLEETLYLCPACGHMQHPAGTCGNCGETFAEPRDLPNEEA